MNKKVKILLIVIVLLIIIRAILPIFITKYVNKVLADIPGYKGSITDVDLNLYRGAYKIDSLKIFKINGQEQVPFVDIPLIDLSVEWSALFDGSIVGELEFTKPSVHFLESEKEENDQYGDDVDWTKPIKELMPLKINKLTINNGDIHFLNIDSEPNIDLYLDNLYLNINNISNVTGKDVLPSSFDLKAGSIGEGKLAINGKANFLKEVPDIDYNFSFEDVQLVALNDFLKAYANIDAESGIFFLYHELAVQDKNMSGYVKPILKDVKILDLEKDSDNVLQLAWESLAAFFAEVFENQPKDQIATRVPINGTLDQVNTGVLPAIWNVFKNAFIQALNAQTDGSVNLQDASNETK